ncbi:MAG: glycosyl transferase family 2 [Bryobacterales bacterium]|nr:glycosyl transferase family 2 [Bryobacterales bacterium]
MRYLLADIEVTNPLPALEIGPDQSGAGVLVRYEDRPVTFFMVPLASGTVSSEELRTLIRDRAGAEITAESLRRELADSPPRSGNLPSLTVAICTKDHPALVERAIRGLLPIEPQLKRQEGFEILVIDNAPSDERTREIVASFTSVGASARYVREPRPGLDFARNRAIKESNSELLAFLDDDAVVDRRWIRGLEKAWAENPEAAAFTGPVLPYELETAAQILFQARGGFGSTFETRRFSADCRELRNYPCNAGCFGTGCNMVFRRSVLAELGGFDEALDTGAPLPGGGDLDIFYRILRAGFVLIKEPELFVWHEHRREHKQLRRQMYTWGLGMMAYAVRNYRSDRSNRARFRCMVLGWFRVLTRYVVSSALGRNGWKGDLAWAELWGGVVGLCGAYDRSKARVERIRRRFA